IRLMGKTSVLIATEGTYPCYSGGVSVWCDYLIRELAEVDFHVFALTHAPSQASRFDLPPNVVSCALHPVWGTEEPGPVPRPFSSVLERKMRTTESIIRSDFLPFFEAAMASILSKDTNPEALGSALLHLYRYCRNYDYVASAGSV